MNNLSQKPNRLPQPELKAKSEMGDYVEFPAIYDADAVVGAIKIILWMLLIGLGVSLVSVGHIAATTTGTLILGSMYAHGMQIFHQCLHMNLFKSRSLNKIVGRVLGFPMLQTFSLSRQQHHEHHWQIDGNLDYYGHLSVKQHFISIFRVVGFGYALLTMMRIVFRFNKTKVRRLEAKARGTVREFKLMALVLGVIVLGGVLSPHFAYFIVTVWVIPSVLVASPILYLLELPEHYHCQLGDRDSFETGRTIIGSHFSFWYTNGSNYHVEHHIYPFIPPDYLPYLNQKIPKRRFSNISRSYLSFYMSLIKGRLRFKGRN